jgi:Bacteriocin-protection, YdeI or OmpD-Associated/Domain of unknown function (DUF1905)
MSDVRATAQRFTAVVAQRPGGGISVSVPFRPEAVWGERDQYHVAGVVAGVRVRGVLTPEDAAGRRLELGPAWCRDATVRAGDDVVVDLALEGPQSTTMGDEAAAAFAAAPDAARFFDSLPTFYRNNHARWIGSAKRPETRTRRIAEVVDLSKRRQRER